MTTTKAHLEEFSLADRVSIMSEISLARPNNAIDEIAFSFCFRSSFSGETLAKELIAVHSALKDQLPDFKLISGVELNIRADTQQVSQEKLPGIVCFKKSLALDGRHEWALRIEGNRIVIACSDYPGWDAFSDRAKEYLLKALEHINLSDNPIIEITGQCTDKFYSTEGHIEFERLFDVESKFLTHFMVENKPTAWHVHQGWFDSIKSANCTSLHNLNIGMQTVTVQGDKANNNSPKEISEASIVHSVRIKKDDEGTFSADEIIASGSEDNLRFSSVIQYMHDSNKKNIGQILSKEILERMGV